MPAPKNSLLEDVACLYFIVTFVIETCKLKDELKNEMGDKNHILNSEITLKEEQRMSFKRLGKGKLWV